LSRPDSVFPGAEDRACIDAVRILAMDAVQQANSGHPGTPMALAPLAYVLWTRHLRHDPRDPQWPDRDRFVLSCGHASMLLYALLHLSGYDLPLSELRAFRQWGSRTPGHPEYGHTPGVETTTGPLGQGFGNAVGMALAAAHLRARFAGAPLVHRTWFVCSDGDLMEGVASEAASLAGHLRIPNLIGFYDDNRITIEGSTDLAFSDDVASRFESYGWRVLHVPDGNDLRALDAAMLAAPDHAQERPVLVVVRTHIAWGSPHKQDSHEAHGAPLGAEEVALTKRNLGWPSSEPFDVPDAVRRRWRLCVERGATLHATWRRAWEAYGVAAPQAARELERRWRRELPPDWEEALPAPGDEAVATRAVSGKALNALAARIPELVGGSADLAPSNNSAIAGEASVTPGSFAGRNLHFGVREHAMGALLNGMALHGGILPYGATFLVFSDYMRGAIRLAALMRVHVIYVFTHDSIGLGEDGPTHQPVETLAALRAMPGLLVVRPADARETAAAWRLALRHGDGPVALVLTRQKTARLDRARLVPGTDFERGAYVLHEAQGGTPRAIVLASGSEVGIAVAAQARLEADGVPTRVVSAPCLERFAAQPVEYRDAVLPPAVRARVAVEAAHPLSWYRWVGDGGSVVGLERYGASAPYERLYAEFGLTPEAVAARVRAALG
jgi:transketolase